MKPTYEELQAEVVRLRALVKASPAARNDYPEDFEQCWAAYPPRPGASKMATYKAWTARIKAGATAVEMLSGTRKYAAFVKAERTEQQYIKQPATFYGPGEHFSADWTIAKANGRKGQMHGSIGEQDFTAGVRPDGSF